MKKFSLQFGGFYYSGHEQLIDSMLESYFDIEGNGEFELPDNINYQVIFNQYSRELLPIYQEFIIDEFDIDVTINFISLYSPREYNFTTDSIDASISNKDFKKLKKYFLNNKDFITYANESSKSRDGFISFYDGIDAIIEDDSILLDYVFKYITTLLNDEFMQYYDTNNMDEMLYSLDFLTEK